MDVYIYNPAHAAATIAVFIVCVINCIGFIVMFAKWLFGKINEPDNNPRINRWIR
jgi:hypothetical protein